MGIRNSCNISLLEICWLSVIVLESYTPSAQKPDSACCIEEVSICLTSMSKQSLPSHCLRLSGVLPAGHWAQWTRGLPTSLLDHVPKGMHICSFWAQTEHTAEIKFSFIINITIFSAYLKVRSARERWRLWGPIWTGCPFLGLGTADQSSKMWSKQTLEVQKTLAHEKKPKQQTKNNFLKFAKPVSLLWKGQIMILECLKGTTVTSC